MTYLPIFVSTFHRYCVLALFGLILFPVYGQAQTKQEQVPRRGLSHEASLNLLAEQDIEIRTYKDKLSKAQARFIKAEKDLRIAKKQAKDKIDALKHQVNELKLAKEAAAQLQNRILEVAFKAGIDTTIDINRIMNHIRDTLAQSFKMIQANQKELELMRISDKQLRTDLKNAQDTIKMLAQENQILNTLDLAPPICHGLLGNRFTIELKPICNAPLGKVKLNFEILGITTFKNMPPFYKSCEKEVDLNQVSSFSIPITDDEKGKLKKYSEFRIRISFKYNEESVMRVLYTGSFKTLMECQIEPLFNPPKGT